MKIKVLGTAAGGGVPQWNCNCPNCKAARSGVGLRRRVASIAVSADGNRWILVNASGDIGEQLNLAPQLWPHSLRQTPFAALALTDANIDHTAGLLEFRQTDDLDVHSTGVTHEALCSAPMFAHLVRGRARWQTFDGSADVVEVRADRPFGLVMHAIGVDGLLPGYAGAQPRQGAAVAYRFEHAGARMVYAPTFLAIDNLLLRELDAANAVFLDGTFWSDDEMLTLGLGNRTAREMGHLPMTGPGGSLELCGELKANMRYFTHINNTNPILDPRSSASQELLGKGFAIPQDGQEITL